MNDRELLERAAKAAGVKGYWDDSYGGVVVRRNASGIAEAFWSPLENDGDALRLAVKLGFAVEVFDSLVTASRAGDCGGAEATIAIGSDPYAATRRAIVCAAAEMDDSSPQRPQDSKNRAK